MSHQIDLGSLGLTRRWNGHLAYGSRLWKLIAARHGYRPSRNLPSDYMEALDGCRFEIRLAVCHNDYSGLHHPQVAPEFRSRSAQDITCNSLFIVALMRNPDLAERVRRAARARVERCFSLTAVVRTHESLYLGNKADAAP